MKISSELPDHAAIVECVLEGFVRANQLLVESGVIPPDPMDVPGVRYQLEGPGEEDWKLGHNVVRDGWGDCEDVACWRPADCARPAKTQRRALSSRKPGSTSSTRS